MGWSEVRNNSVSCHVVCLFRVVLNLGLPVLKPFQVEYYWFRLVFNSSSFRFVSAIFEPFEVANLSFV